MSAADIALVSRAATYRNVADYERTWEATAEILAEAFSGVDPLVARIRQHLVATNWISDRED